MHEEANAPTLWRAQESAAEGVVMTQSQADVIGQMPRAQRRKRSPGR